MILWVLVQCRLIDECKCLEEHASLSSCLKFHPEEGSATLLSTILHNVISHQTPVLTHPCEDFSIIPLFWMLLTILLLAGCNEYIAKHKCIPRPRRTVAWQEKKLFIRCTEIVDNNWPWSSIAHRQTTNTVKNYLIRILTQKEVWRKKSPNLICNAHNVTLTL